MLSPAIMLTPDDIRLQLKQLGRKQIDLAQAIGMDKFKFSRAMNGARRFQMDEMQKIGTVLAQWQKSAPISERALRHSAPAVIPLYGIPDDDGHGVSVSERDAIEWISGHPGQRVKDGAMAVRVSDEDMVPRYLPGEIVYVEPIPPARGANACITLKNGSAIITRYEGQHDGCIWHTQLAIDGQQSIPAGQIKTLYRVVGTG